jgi:CubicO group peptidase (beta-lactamase class C family)
MHTHKLRNYVFTLIACFSTTPAVANSAIVQSPNKSELGSQIMQSSSSAQCGLDTEKIGVTAGNMVNVQKMLDAIIEGKRAAGIAIGWVTPQGRCVVTSGSSGKTARPKIDGDTMFELGSITKALTGTLLADMVAKGELKLDDPIGPYLPIAAQGNTSLAAVTFRQLTTHSAGIARVPMTLAFLKAGLTDPSDPYANYSESDFVADLANMTVKHRASYAYSNTGGALLGMLLANRAGQSYSELVHKRLLDPSAMSATSLVPAKSDDALAAQPHDTKLKATVGWNLGAFVPTGGARSSVNDMMKLIDANLQRQTPWVHTHTQLAALGQVGGISFNWHFARLVAKAATEEKRDTLIWHNGGTYGSTSFVGFDVERGIGVVVLVNTGSLGLADEIGMYLWDQRNPKPATQATKTSMGVLQGTLAAIAFFSSIALATRARATLRAGGSTQSMTSATTLATAHPPSKPRSVARWLPNLLSAALFKPFLDRIEILLATLNVFAATLFIADVLPATTAIGALTLQHVLYLAAAVAALVAIASLRNAKWWVASRWTRWISIAFQTLLSALFIWIAIA